MELQFLDSSNKHKLPADIFECDFNEPLIHQAVTAFMSSGRSGTHAQKTRSEVSGGGIKPFRQKGTGRARAGTIRSPLWRKGGVIFAAKTRSYMQKVNKKAYRGAIRSIFAELNRQNRFAAVEVLNLTTPKTKDFLKVLAGLLNEPKAKKGEAKKASRLPRILIITETMDANLLLATRNLSHVEVREAFTIDPVALVNADKVIVTKNALNRIEEWLK